MESQELTRSVWDVDAGDFPETAQVSERARFCLRYAVLAPSSHNAQPWRFHVRGRQVEVYADTSRRLEVADPDGRELLLSVGCAVENLRVAAEQFGLDPSVAYHADADPVATVTLDPEGSSDGGSTALFDAITERYTSHEPFADRPVPDAALARLRESVADLPVSLRLVTDEATRGTLADLQAEADERLMDDPDYRRELGRWVGSGALGHSWAGARVGQVVVTYLDLGDREGRKNATLLRDAPAVAVLVTETDDPVARARAGQAFERLALVATDEGLAVHPLSQTLERPELRERLAELLGVEGGVPQHLFRLGYDDGEADHTPRWPVETVLDGP